MPYLMQVRDLDEQLVPGYRTLNVIAMTPGQRDLLYHHLFSSQAPDFLSEPAEVQQALQTVSQALNRLKESKTVTWLLDSGFDDLAVWRTIWEQQEHVVSRLYHTDRKVAFQDRQGEWHESDIAVAVSQLRSAFLCRNELRGQAGQTSAAQKATSAGRTGGLSVATDLSEQYAPQRRRPKPHARGVASASARTGRRVGVLAAADRLARDYCRASPAHLSHVSTTLERGRLLQVFEKLPGLGRGASPRSGSHSHLTVVALGWVAASFLFNLGVNFEWEEVQLLAKLGGWEPHKDRTPGKIILLRGLRRLLEMLSTQAMLSDYALAHQGLPPNIAAFLQKEPPPNQL